MRLIDVAKEEQRRRLAGEPPLPLSPPPSAGWLSRSGYAWRMHLGNWAVLVGFFLLVAGFLRLPQWGFAPFLFGWLLAALGSGLTYSLRCRICRVNVHRCRTALSVPSSRRRAWLAELEACPVCGDDGLATPESKQRWLEAGAPREPRYWSKRRATLALLFAVIFVGGGILVAELTIRYSLRR